MLVIKLAFISFSQWLPVLLESLGKRDALNLGDFYVIFRTGLKELDFNLHCRFVLALLHE